MKQANSDVINEFGIKNLDEDHQAIFHYIEQLQDLVNEPKNQAYAVGILERLLSFFLAHVINEEQQLQQYLPTNIVDEHILLHQSELVLLDKSIKSLKVKLTANNIQTIADQLNQEFKNHIYRYDRNIIQKLIKVKRAKL
ncbi:hypothetical protein CXF85_22080 [Colwellia sp. 75C3]|uniref:hemerythrin domain-containing protein n=1 Tax=Colwellia sp. 75C3 TaxID=888425 RepID=UPI000C34B9DE|nr:hemerythrin domain-containing protein [Colwellia sp. 75C3]PKG80798.1 hypothetical protein CXF85_22080 [Colwellia sp. 75C3]